MKGYLANLLLIIMSSSFVIQVGFTKPLLKCIKERGMLAVGLGAGVVNMFLSGLVLYYFEHGLISIATSKLYVYVDCSLYSNYNNSNSRNKLENNIKSKYSS